MSPTKHIKFLKRRLGCFLSIDHGNKIIKFLGYGTLEVMEIPKGYPNRLSSLYETNKWTTERIKLDNNDIVWGCDCHWDFKPNIEKELELFINRKYKIINITMKESSQEFLNTHPTKRKRGRPKGIKDTKPRKKKLNAKI